MKQKIAAFCNVEERAVIGAKTCPRSTKCHWVLRRKGVDALILKYLHKEAPEADLSKWQELVDRVLQPQGRSFDRHRRQICGV